MKERVHRVEELTPEEAEQLARMIEMNRPRKREISRGEFMISLHAAATSHLRNFLKCRQVAESLDTLDKNEYRVQYFKDEDGNPSYEAKPKGKAGFAHLRKKKP